MSDRSGDDGAAAGSPERAALERSRDAVARLRALPAEPPAPREPGALQAALGREIVGLEKARRRLLEALALAQVPGAPPQAAILLSGPAGAGKGALVRALAAASGRSVARVGPPRTGDAGLLGRARAEGGGGPGEVARALLEAGTRAPLLWLDGVEAREDDPALDALLDPAARGALEERGLEVPLDLSRALVVATARHPGRLSERVRRRAQEIALPGYGREEKLEILSRALLPQAQRAHPAGAAATPLSKDALALLASAYSPGPGVHDLARVAGDLLARAAAAALLGEPQAPVGVADLLRLVGPPPPASFPRRVAEVGVATGVGMSADGATPALVEAIRDPSGAAPRSGGHRRDAAEAAIAFVDARADRLRVDPGGLREGGFRLRVTGAAPLVDDDAGDLAVFLALVSLASDRPVRPDVALAAGLTLRGVARPAAGVAEKVLAAARAGARRVLVADADLPAITAALEPQALASIEVVPVAHADEAVREALIDIVIAREVR